MSYIEQQRYDYMDGPHKISKRREIFIFLIIEDIFGNILQPVVCASKNAAMIYVFCFIDTM